MASPFDSVLGVEDDRGRCLGSAFVIAERCVVTCWHVLAEAVIDDADHPAITLRTGRDDTLLVHRRVWQHPSEDIAYIELTTPTAVPPLPLVAGLARLAARAWERRRLAAWGTPGNDGRPTSTRHIRFSALQRRETDRLAKSFELLSGLPDGMSGGPVTVQGRRACVGMARLGGTGTTMSTALTSDLVLDGLTCIDGNIGDVTRVDVAEIVHRVDGRAVRTSRQRPPNTTRQRLPVADDRPLEAGLARVVPRAKSEPTIAWCVAPGLLVIPSSRATAIRDASRMSPVDVVFRDERARDGLVQGVGANAGTALSLIECAGARVLRVLEVARGQREPASTRAVTWNETQPITTVTPLRAPGVATHVSALPVGTPLVDEADRVFAVVGSASSVDEHGAHHHDLLSVHELATIIRIDKDTTT